MRWRTLMTLVVSREGLTVDSTASPIGKPSTHGRDACSISHKGQVTRWRVGVVLLASGVVACQSNARDSDVPPPLKAAAGSIGNPTGPSSEKSTVTAGTPLPSTAMTTLSKDSPSQRVSECAPCRFVAGPNAAFDVTFKAGPEQSVAQLKVSGRAGAPAPGGGAQTFALNDASSPTGEFLVQAIDINFDGVLDFAFGPILGTPNLELQYWVVDSGTSQWMDVGRLSNLKVRTDARELETSEKGGHAGLLFKNDVYRWAGGRLERVREVEQTEGAVVGQYRKTTRLFKDDQVVSESSENIKAPQQ